jgi:allene oxide cyclase-like protein
MRKVPLAGAAAALVLGLAGVVSFAAASQAAGPSPAKSKTLVFDVVFSPPEFIQANNVRNPHSPFALGDELVFHDQLFSTGQHVGDEGGSCVLVSVPPATTLANCSEVVRLPHGTITAQFLNAPPPHKKLAITGGTGVYNTAGGDGTLVEFGNGKGRLTLHVLSLVARGGSA